MNGMILDRKVNLPEKTQWYGITDYFQDGQDYTYWAQFSRLRFHINYKREVTIWGKITLKKEVAVPKTRPWWSRFLLLSRSEPPKVIWTIETGSTEDVIGRDSSDLHRTLINAGLEDRLLLHDSMLNTMLAGPLEEVRGFHSRAASEILGQIKAIQDVA